MLRLLPEFRKPGLALDYGAGNLRNSLFLAARGFQVLAVDLPERMGYLGELKERFQPWGREITPICPRLVEYFTGQMDLVICTFVLNLLPPEERAEVLKTCCSSLKVGGYFLLEMVEKRPYTKNPRALTREDLDPLILSQGLKYCSCYRGRVSLGILYQKNPAGIWPVN